MRLIQRIFIALFLFPLLTRHKIQSCGNREETYSVNSSELHTDYKSSSAAEEELGDSDIYGYKKIYKK